MRASGLLLSLLSLFILTIGLTSALKFGFSPPEISLDYAHKCTDIQVYSSEFVRIDFEERWSEVQSKDLRDYKILNESFLAHRPYIQFKDKSSFQLCLLNNLTFSPYGLLIMHLSNSSFSGGVWVRVDNPSSYSEKKRVIEEPSKGYITGFIGQTSSETGNNRNFALQAVLAEFTFLEVLILGFLGLRLKWKKV